MAFGFVQPYPTKFEPWTVNPTDLPDGRNWRLLEPLIYRCKDGRLLRTAVGTLTDGVSTPREVWNIIAPFDWFCCGALHDGCFHDTIELYAEVNETWNHCSLTEAQANDLIDEALESRGCGVIERNTIFVALKAFGKFAFDSDRSSPPKPTPVPC